MPSRPLFGDPDTAWQIEEIKKVLSEMDRGPKRFPFGPRDPFPTDTR